MSIENALNQSIVLESRNAYDAHGQYSYAAPATEAARVEQKISTLKGVDGNLLVSPTRVFLGPASTVKVGDLITCPGDLPQQVAWIRKEMGLLDVDHIVAFLSTAGGS